jgi:hypothetical protein
LDIGALTFNNGNVDFKFVDTNDCNNAHLVQNASCQFTVAFNPATAGLKDGYIDIPSNGVTGRDLQIGLTGEGIAVDTSADLGIALRQNPTVMDIGTNYPISFTATNNGVATAQNAVVTVTLPNGISLTEAKACKLVNLNTVTCTVDTFAKTDKFTPYFTIHATEAAIGKRLRISASIKSDNVDKNSANNKVSTPTILFRFPDIKLSVASLTFGNHVLAVDTKNTDQKITITSTGTSALKVGKLSIAGVAKNDYILINDACSTKSLAPKAICAFNVQFKPTAKGVRNAEVVMPSNVEVIASTIKLSGMGIYLNMNDAKCRYVAPIFGNIWQLMKVAKQPTCAAALNYHTWIRIVRLEYDAKSNYFVDRLAGVDARTALFNKGLELVDGGVSAFGEVADLQSLLPIQDAKAINDIWKSKNIVKSFANNKIPLSELGPNAIKIAAKWFAEKIVGAPLNFMCNIFDDAKSVANCNKEAEKIAKCGVGLAGTSLGFLDKKETVANCVLGGLTSALGVVNSISATWDASEVESKLNGHILINRYIDAYYRGIVLLPGDDVRLENDLMVFAAQKPALLNDNYDIKFVKKNIFEGVARTSEIGAKSVKFRESLQNLK